MGYLRNLTAAEIVDQIMQASRLAQRTITNIVFMGMGEPLMNYDNVMKAVAIIVEGLGIAARRVTVSTAGWADRIRRMADERQRVKLAVSLHSVNETVRTRLMPITRRFGLDALLSALEYYYRATRLRVTYEYIFFEGINDTDGDVAALVRWARRVPCKINVIPFHSIDFTAPTGLAARLKPSPRTAEIVETLRSNHLTVFLRGSAGEDIAAACGQLALAEGSGRQPSRETTRRRRPGSSRGISHVKGRRAVHTGTPPTSTTIRK